MTEIYKHSFAHAQKNGELDAFRESNRRNQDCAAAIDKAIADSHHDQHSYKLPAAVDAVSKEFGLDRVAWVMAMTIQHHDYDGRYSRTNKDWAQEFPIPRDRESFLLLNSHPVLLDGFAQSVRRTRIFELAQTVGAYEKSHHMAERNRLTISCDDLGGFVAKPDVTERRLAERCAEIAEKQSVLTQLRAAKKSEKSAPVAEEKLPSIGIPGQHGYSAKFAEDLLDGMEDAQQRSLFSTDEKNLVCNYAFHTGDPAKTRQLAEELAAARFGMQYGGGVHPAIAARINAEITAIDERWAELDAVSPIAAVEMSTEQNYNQIDGLRNNMAVPRPDLTDGQTLDEIRELAPETLIKESSSAVEGSLTETNKGESDTMRKLELQAVFERKASNFQTAGCVVEQVIRLPGREFDFFKDNLLRDYDFIRDNVESMYVDNNKTHYLFLPLNHVVLW